MEGYYPILHDGQNAGDAVIKKEGLYLHIRCQCRVPNGTRCRLTLQSDGIKQSLGLCASDSGFAEISIRISSKEAGKPPYSFHLEEENNEPFIPVFPDSPFSDLARLENARFAIHEGIAGVVFRKS